VTTGQRLRSLTCDHGRGVCHSYAPMALRTEANSLARRYPDRRGPVNDSRYPRILT